MVVKKYRAIIIKDGDLLVMKRQKNGRIFYVLPGGTIESGETPSECCKRELAEEFGIDIEPMQMIYEIHQADTVQGFFVAKWLSGDIHKTDAEEYTCDTSLYGTFEPTSISLQDLVSAPLVPAEVKAQLLDDLDRYGTTLDRPLIEFDCEWS